MENETKTKEKKKRRSSDIRRQQEEKLNSDAFFEAQREEADIYAAERDNLLDQAQIAFDCNDYPAAKELSDQAKAQHTLYEEANKVAADVIFKTNNTRVKSHEIDFHGLYVEEAMELLKHRIMRDNDLNVKQLTVIYGQGERNNDPEGEREIVIAIADYFKNERICHKFDFEAKKCRVTYGEDLRSETPVVLDNDSYDEQSLDSTPKSCCVVS